MKVVVKAGMAKKLRNFKLVLSVPNTSQENHMMFISLCF